MRCDVAKACKSSAGGGGGVRIECHGRRRCAREERLCLPDDGEAGGGRRHGRRPPPPPHRRRRRRHRHYRRVLRCRVASVSGSGGAADGPSTRTDGRRRGRGTGRPRRCRTPHGPVLFLLPAPSTGRNAPATKDRGAERTRERCRIVMYAGAYGPPSPRDREKNSSGSRGSVAIPIYVPTCSIPIPRCWSPTGIRGPRRDRSIDPDLDVRLCTSYSLFSSCPYLVAKYFCFADYVRSRWRRRLPRGIVRCT